MEENGSNAPDSSTMSVSGDTAAVDACDWLGIVLFQGNFVDSRGSFQKRSNPSLLQGISCPVGCTGSIPESFHRTVLVTVIDCATAVYKFMPSE
jgi:hypothetical protein